MVVYPGELCEANEYGYLRVKSKKSSMVVAMYTLGEDVFLNLEEAIKCIIARRIKKIEDFQKEIKDLQKEVDYLQESLEEGKQNFEEYFKEYNDF